MIHAMIDGVIAVAALVAMLDYFGLKPKQPLWGLAKPLNRNWKLAMMLGLVAAALGMSGYGFYRSLHPKIVEKLTEKIIEKPVPIPCPESSKESKPAKSGTQSKPKVPSKAPESYPAFSVTNPSGSIINQGSTANAPQTVNNFGPPPAKITTWEQKPAQWQEAGGLVAETQLTLTIDHSTEIPAFAVKCDRPCRVRDAVVFGAYNKVNCAYPFSSTRYNCL